MRVVWATTADILQEVWQEAEYRLFEALAALTLNFSIFVALHSLYIIIIIIIPYTSSKIKTIKFICILAGVPGVARYLSVCLSIYLSIYI
jgi:hypothetical protein